MASAATRPGAPGRLRLENRLDEAYRTHGSGVDGMGRAARVAIRAGF